LFAAQILRIFSLKWHTLKDGPFDKDTLPVE